MRCQSPICAQTPQYKPSFATPPPNPNFAFHQQFSKSLSTVMQNAQTVSKFVPEKRSLKMHIGNRPNIGASASKNAAGDRPKPLGQSAPWGHCYPCTCQHRDSLLGGFLSAVLSHGPEHIRFSPVGMDARRCTLHPNYALRLDSQQGEARGECFKFVCQPGRTGRQLDAVTKV